MKDSQKARKLHATKEAGLTRPPAQDPMDFGPCPEGMRPVVWEAFQRSLRENEALYRALAKS